MSNRDRMPMSKKKPRTFLRKLADEADKLFQGRGVEQYAALCYRKLPGSSEMEVLLISTRSTGRWIIPKGWPMERKLPHQVAEREAWEEAGVKGKAKKAPFGYYTYLKTLEDGEKVPSVVQVHLLEVSTVETNFPEQGQRDSVWLSPYDAALRVREPELQSLLQSSAVKLTARPKMPRIIDHDDQANMHHFRK